MYQPDPDKLRSHTIRDPVIDMLLDLAIPTLTLRSTDQGINTKPYRGAALFAWTATPTRSIYVAWTVAIRTCVITSASYVKLGDDGAL